MKYRCTLQTLVKGCLQGLKNNYNNYGSCCSWRIWVSMSRLEGPLLCSALLRKPRKIDHDIAKWPVIFEPSLSKLVCIIILSVKYDRLHLIYTRGPSQKNIVTEILNFGREQGATIHRHCCKEHLQNSTEWPSLRVFL